MNLLDALLMLLGIAFIFISFFAGYFLGHWEGYHKATEDWVEMIQEERRIAETYLTRTDTDSESRT